MYILILFFILIYSVFIHADCFSAHIKQPYGYIREPYFRDPYSSEFCEWVLDLGYYNILEIRIESLNLVLGDFIYIRDGLNFNSQTLAKLYGSSNFRKFTTSSGSAIIYFSRNKRTSQGKISQFNITYQIKGRCIPKIQAPCSESELNCYDLRYEKCDSIWNCPISGKDEQSCYSCPDTYEEINQSRFPCSEILNSKCYSRQQRCNGVRDCDTLADELNCDPLLCGEHNKTFLCSTIPSQCISESLRCDGTPNCRDGSDERNCVVKSPYYESGHFRVIIVASLSAILFLVMIALCLLCICRLHKIRLMSSRSLARRRGHLSPDDSAVQQLIDAEMRRQPPPPNYSNAIRYSKPFSSPSDLERLLLQAGRKARGGGSHKAANGSRGRRYLRLGAIEDGGTAPGTVEGGLACLGATEEPDVSKENRDSVLEVPAAEETAPTLPDGDAALIDPGNGSPH